MSSSPAKPLRIYASALHFRRVKQRTFLFQTSDGLPFARVPEASCAAARVGSSTSSMPKVLRKIICASFMTALNVPRCEPITFLEISSRRSGMRRCSWKSASRTKSIARFFTSYRCVHLIIFLSHFIVRVTYVFAVILISHVVVLLVECYVLILFFFVLDASLTTSVTLRLWEILRLRLCLRNLALGS
jgi:hypothetical protein